MKHTPISRRDFLKNLGIAGAGTLLAASPWLSAFSEVTNTSNEKCRLAIIGPGSRGRFLIGFLAKNPKVEIVATFINRLSRAHWNLCLMPKCMVTTGKCWKISR